MSNRAGASRATNADLASGYRSEEFEGVAFVYNTVILDEYTVHARLGAPKTQVLIGSHLLQLLARQTDCAGQINVHFGVPAKFICQSAVKQDSHSASAVLGDSTAMDQFA
jgi:hypothetical protein